MVGRALLLAALIPAALGYSNTSPVIAWTSHSSAALSNAPKSAHTTTFLESLLLDESICDHDAVVLIEQQGLHATDLQALPDSHALTKSLNAAPSSLELPYMRRSAENPFLDLADIISRRCGSRLLNIAAGDVGPHIEDNKGKKHVMCMGMPSIEGAASHRKHMISVHASQLTSDLEKVTAAFPKYIVVYAGWGPTVHPRQLSGDGSNPFESAVEEAKASAAPSVKVAPSKDGILHRYQLLTPALIVGLIVAFFLLVPVVLLGVNALASIESPIKSFAPKSFDATQKKNQ